MNTKKQYLIENLLKINKQYAACQLTLEQAFTFLKSKYPNISEERFKDIQDHYGLEYFFNKLVEIYANNFEEEEIIQIMNFYTSDVGKKMFNQDLILQIDNLAKDWVNYIENKLQE